MQVASLLMLSCASRWLAEQLRLWRRRARHQLQRPRRRHRPRNHRCRLQPQAVERRRTVLHSQEQLGHWLGRKWIRAHGSRHQHRLHCVRGDLLRSSSTAASPSPPREVPGRNYRPEEPRQLPPRLNLLLQAPVLL